MGLLSIFKKHQEEQKPALAPGERMVSFKGPKDPITGSDKYIYHSLNGEVTLRSENNGISVEYGFSQKGKGWFEVNTPPEFSKAIVNTLSLGSNTNAVMIKNGRNTCNEKYSGSLETVSSSLLRHLHSVNDSLASTINFKYRDAIRNSYTIVDFGNQNQPSQWDICKIYGGLRQAEQKGKEFMMTMQQQKRER